MEYKTVLVEREEKNGVRGASGLMLNGRYVLTTSSLFSDVIKANTFTQLQKTQPGKIHTLNSININFNVIWRNERELFVTKKSRIFACFVCKTITESDKNIFKEWTIELPHRDSVIVNDILSVFFLLRLENKERGSTDELKNILETWWSATWSNRLQKTTEINIVSVPFGNRNFLDTYSRGIVSNIVGLNGCLLISDCPANPGSEGSPVYFRQKYEGKSNEEAPVGIVLATLCWWRGEWTGLTLIADIRPILTEMLDIQLGKFPISLNNCKLFASVDSSLVQIYCGNSWGTAVLISKEKGIFLTNSHVVFNTHCIKLHWKNIVLNAEIVYQTPGDCLIYDLAVLKCVESLLELNLQPVQVCPKRIEYNKGATVYSAGYSLFPKECKLSPTISEGTIAENNSHVLKTTCCVHPGTSGGAIFDPEGFLLGIIVCNTKLQETGVVYPRLNMSVPIKRVWDVLMTYLVTEDKSILKRLKTDDHVSIKAWMRLEGKL